MTIFFAVSLVSQCGMGELQVRLSCFVDPQTLHFLSFFGFARSNGCWNLFSFGRPFVVDFGGSSITLVFDDWDPSACEPWNTKVLPETYVTGTLPCCAIGMPSVALGPGAEENIYGSFPLSFSFLAFFIRLFLAHPCRL